MAKSDIQMGLSVNSCAECEKNNIGAKILELFKTGLGKPSYFIKYKDGVCYLNEQVLMSIIRMANPFQTDKKIKIVSHNEFKKLLSRKED